MWTDGDDLDFIVLHVAHMFYSDTIYCLHANQSLLVLQNDERRISLVE
jgi:hypothetical protein